MPMCRRLTSAACLAQGWDGLSVSGAKDSGEVPAGRPWFEGHSAVLALPKLGVRRLRLHHIRCLHIRRDAGVGSAFSRRPSARCTSSSRWRHSRSGAHKDGLRGRSRNSRRDRTTSSRDGTPGLTRHCDPCRPAAFRQLTVSFAGGAGSQRLHMSNKPNVIMRGGPADGQISHLPAQHDDGERGEALDRYVGEVRER